MINTTKPSSSPVNTLKVNAAELWSTITSTWASETRTWAEAGSLIVTVAKVTSSITNTVRPS